MKCQAMCTLLFSFLLLSPSAHADGTLKPKGSPDQAIEILDHHVEVTIDNGFARTEVSQTFFNPNPFDLEAIYSFSVPKSASLAEMTIVSGEVEMHGEVVKADEAERIYAEKRDNGEEAGLAEKNSYLTYEFSLARAPALAEISFRFVYYQPLEIDTGVGRFVYPLEEGGTDEVALSFWDTEREVRRSFSFHLTLESDWPVESVRMPGFEAAAQIQQLDTVDRQLWDVRVDVPGGISLERDVVVYYRLQDGLPGRMDLVPYRADANGTGTFMLVVTPGVDLGPLTGGADYVFALDVSGSMAGKLHTLTDGVVRAMGELGDQDRFKIVTFSNSARDITGGWKAASAKNVARAVHEIQGLRSEGGTNVYSGLQLALDDLDADRATSLVLVTDGVTNQGELAPERFRALAESHDVRVFGYLLGNGANWPLMRTICDASGGYYAGVSNADDIVGQLLLAKSKITHECLHDARVTFDGANVHDVTQIRSKVYRGQQLVLFGRYSEPGPLEVRLHARLTGVDQVYSTSTFLPEVDTDNPELERLWALDRIEEIQARVDRGEEDASEGEQAIADLGVAYQLVTDETSMLVLDDGAFESEGIERNNRERVGRERAAQSRRASVAGPRKSYRADANAPAFPSTAPSTKGTSGAGAIDPLSLALAAAAVALLAPALRKRSRTES